MLLRPLSPDQEHQPASIFFQPFYFCLVIGDYSCDLCPETGRVVHLLSVAQLVDDDVVEDLRRCQEKKAVEIKVSLGAAASPAGFLAADRDAAVIDTNERSKVRDALGNHNGGSLFETAQLSISQRGDRIGFFLCLALQDFRTMNADPFAFFIYEPFNVAHGHAHRGANDDTAVFLDLYSKGFPFASDQFIFHERRCLRNAG